MSRLERTTTPMQQPKKKAKRKHGQTKSRYLSRQRNARMDESVADHTKILNILMGGNKTKALTMVSSLTKTKRNQLRGYLKDLNCYFGARDMLIEHINELNKKK